METNWSGPGVGFIVVNTPIVTIATFPQFPLTLESRPNGITSGPDGRIWFTDARFGAPAVGKVALFSGVTEFPLPSQSVPTGIASGSDGNLWFTDANTSSPALGRVTPAGNVTEYDTGEAVPSSPVRGPDGNLWFTTKNGFGRLLLAEPSLTVHCNGSGAVTVSSPLPGPSENLCGKTLNSTFAPGTTLLLQAVPAAGWTFAGWSGACSGGGACEVTMNGAQSITATFGPEPTPNLTVAKIGAGSGTVMTEPSGIDCGGICAAEFEEGSKVKLTAETDPGSEFREWIGACSGAAATCEVTMSEAKAVSARFSRERPILTLDKTGGGSVKSMPRGVSCSATCSQALARYYKGATLVLAARAVTGGALEGWEGCDSSTNTGLEGTCTVAMDKARTVEATFKEAQPPVNPQPLLLSKAPSTGYGTVKAPSLACEVACTSTRVAYFGGTTEPKFKAAATATLIATPSAGSQFAGWTGCESEPEGKCVVLMSEAQSVTAEFEAKPAETLTLDKAGAGAVKSKPKGIACGRTCSSAVASLPQDMVVVLAAKAAMGSTFTGWEDCKVLTQSELESTCETTLTSAKAVKATFSAALKPLISSQTLTLTKAGYGYGTVKATGLVCEAACTSTTVAYYGEVVVPKFKAAATVTLIATPSVGSEFTGWTGCESEPEGKCVVLMSKARSVTARFEE